MLEPSALLLVGIVISAGIKCVQLAKYTRLGELPTIIITHT